MIVVGPLVDVRARDGLPRSYCTVPSGRVGRCRFSHVEIPYEGTRVPSEYRPGLPLAVERFLVSAREDQSSEEAGRRTGQGERMTALHTTVASSVERAAMQSVLFGLG